MTRPYEMPLYPIPPILGIVSNLVLAVVFVWFNPQTLLLAAAWVGLGVVAYVALDRIREPEPERERGPVSGEEGSATDAGESDFSPGGED